MQPDPDLCNVFLTQDTRVSQLELLVLEAQRKSVEYGALARLHACLVNSIDEIGGHLVVRIGVLPPGFPLRLLRFSNVPLVRASTFTLDTLRNVAKPAVRNERAFAVRFPFLRCLRMVDSKVLLVAPGARFRVPSVDRECIGSHGRNRSTIWDTDGTPDGFLACSAFIKPSFIGVYAALRFGAAGGIWNRQ
jgi:hypothetical protein